MTATEGTLDETGVEEEGYKEKYKNLKRKLESLLYEQECFNEELRKVQKRCLQVSRDKSFLLDRLLQYEKVIDSSTDDEMTESSTSSSEDEIEPPQKVVKTKSSAKSNVKKASNTPQKPETATPLPTQKSGKQTAKSTKRETAQNKVSKPAGKKIGEAEKPKQKSPPKRVHPPVGGKDIRTIQEAMEESSETCSSEETEEETEEELVIDLPR